jgi:signal transduction histidine kinase
VAEAVAAERQALLARVVAAQEEERRRVAHEVHDGVTQLAHAAALRLDALAERLAAGGAPDAADLADLARARDLTRRAAADARRLIAGLRPEALDALGLAEAVRQEVAVLRAEGWRADVADGAPAPRRRGACRRRRRSRCSGWPRRP